MSEPNYEALTGDDATMPDQIKTERDGPSASAATGGSEVGPLTLRWVPNRIVWIALAFIELLAVCGTLSDKVLPRLVGLIYTQLAASMFTLLAVGKYLKDHERTAPPNAPGQPMPGKER